jgi:asparagine synthase (glutamine-hydrolysing)
MCGIVGFAGQPPFFDPYQVLKNMAQTITHRGPDDEGYVVTPGVGLGFRRLSIIDLETGHQPIFNEKKNIAIVLNGEIYNFPELRDALAGKRHRFYTQTDVETVVHLYEEYGVDCLQHMNGMFAFALWDTQKQRLFIARDRFGKKPVYYTFWKDTLIFASELKAFRAIPDLPLEIDLPSLQKYLTHEYVPTPHSIFKGIHKLEAGHFLLFENRTLKKHTYWDYNLQPSYGNTATEEEWKERFDHIFRESVRRRLISDVPLGVFLSGGIDSSSVVAYMADLIDPHKIKTFSIGFEDRSFDESNYARIVADHFGTDHHEQILHSDALKDMLPYVFSFLDEPFADASIIPTYLLSKFTREHVTVALGGDGGDELFMGYPTFFANQLNRIYHILPSFLHSNVIHPLAKKLPVNMRNLSLDFLIKQFLRGSHVPASYREQVWLGAFMEADLHQVLQIPEVLDADRLYEEVIGFHHNATNLKPLDRLSYFYVKMYLHDDILVKVDRASMAVSLEARTPFLDVEMAHLAQTLPCKYKFHINQGKYLMKKVLESKLPRVILNRPKKGFGIPIAHWFRSDLKEMVQDIFAPEKIKREGFFNATQITQLLQDHFNGVQDNRKQLWTLFVFEWWLDTWYHS